MNTSEYLSRDILEKDFLKTFTPYHFVQKIYGSCRVDARDRFATAPTIGQKVYTSFCMILIIYLYIRILFKLHEQYYDVYTNIFYLLAAILTTQLIVFLANLFHVRFMNCNRNVELIIKMQAIERLMNVDKNKRVNKLRYRFSLFTVIFLVVIIFVHFGILCYKSGIATALSLYILFSYCGAPFTLEISHCSNILFYYIVRVRITNAIILNHLDGENKGRKSIFPSTSHLKYIASILYDFKTSETDIYLREILKGFNFYKELYAFQILLFSIKIFFYILLTFEYVLLTMKNNIIDPTELLVHVSVVTLDLLAAIMLGLRCETLLRSLKQTKLLSISIMSIYLEGPLREKAKRMYKIIDEVPPSFSVYDMWNMDARFLLALFNVMTNLIVTLLQFAFL